MFSPSIKKKKLWNIFFNIECFVVFRKLLLVRFCFVVWEFFSVFSIFFYASFGDRTGSQHEETTETSQKDVKNFVECGF